MDLCGIPAVELPLEYHLISLQEPKGISTGFLWYSSSGTPTRIPLNFTAEIQRNFHWISVVFQQWNSH